MANTISVSHNRLERIEFRIGTLEKAVRDLVRVIKATGKQNDFSQLYNSKIFQNHKNSMINRFKKNRSGFVDPFDTYQKG